ncbi:MAG: DUF695 domain-containing protein [Deltaproteobacteria bacterium]|nr:DUF695 domain-containing protein [Deltaproteobacteria bacterium]
MSDAIHDFWTWWKTHNESYAHAFDSHQPLSDELIGEMNERVAAISKNLDWEFGPGSKSRHHLCLSAGGDPVLRVITERWLKKGPPASEVWEYYPARQPHGSAGISLRFDGHDIPLDKYQFEIVEDTNREVLDIQAFHPSFAAMKDENARGQALFISLDNLLGEDGVEQWLGDIKVVDASPANAASSADLRDRMNELASRAKGDRWCSMQGERDGRPSFVTANLAVKRMQHLLLEMHLTVTLPFAKPNEHGLPTKEESTALDALEDELFATLDAHALYLGRMTGNGVRTLHFRVMEGGPAPSLVERWAEKHKDKKRVFEIHMDPRWEKRAWR